MKNRNRFGIDEFEVIVERATKDAYNEGYDDGYKQAIADVENVEKLKSEISKCGDMDCVICKDKEAL